MAAARSRTLPPPVRGGRFGILSPTGSGASRDGDLQELTEEARPVAPRGQREPEGQRPLACLPLQVPQRGEELAPRAPRGEPRDSRDHEVLPPAPRGLADPPP